MIVERLENAVVGAALIRSAGTKFLMIFTYPVITRYTTRSHVRERTYLENEALASGVKQSITRGSRSADGEAKRRGCRLVRESRRTSIV